MMWKREKSRHRTQRFSAPDPTEIASIQIMAPNDRLSLISEVLSSEMDDTMIPRGINVVERPPVFSPEQEQTLKEVHTELSKPGPRNLGRDHWSPLPPPPSPMGAPFAQVVEIRVIRPVPLETEKDHMDLAVDVATLGREKLEKGPKSVSDKDKRHKGHKRSAERPQALVFEIEATEEGADEEES
jgi:hypothetical protein